MTETLVASVVMPERGVFFVRCQDSISVDDCTRGREAIVSLDYGEDVGEVVSAAAYDPAAHGDRIPSYRLERFTVEADNAIFEECDKLAKTISEAFEKSARIDVPDFRVIGARVSFGRTRFFVRYASERRKPNLSRVFGEIRRQFGVSINAWQAGPRDEVACMGAIGPCGRTCCCASWQKRYPVKVSPPPGVNPSCLNGVCGRFKCCWSFEG